MTAEQLLLRLALGTVGLLWSILTAFTAFILNKAWIKIGELEAADVVHDVRLTALETLNVARRELDAERRHQTRRQAAGDVGQGG